MTLRQFEGSPKVQGSDETVANYTIDFAEWGTPVGPTVKLYDINDNNADVSTSCITGSPSVTGDVVNLPAVHDLVKDHAYRLVCTCTFGTSTLSGFFVIQCKDDV